MEQKNLHQKAITKFNEIKKFNIKYYK